VTNGYLDDLPIKSVADFERGLLDHMNSRHADIGEAINESGKLEEDLEKRLREAIDEFKSSFTEQVETVETVAAEEGVPDVSDTPAAESGDAAGQSADRAEEEEEDTSEQGTSSDSDDGDSDDGESSEDRKEG
jgi:F-type H+-transporting ATPase subunit alpha